MSWYADVDDDGARFIVRSRVTREGWTLASVGLVGMALLAHASPAAVAGVVGLLTSGALATSPRVWPRAVVIELDRVQLVARRGRHELLRVPTTALLRFNGGQWSRPPERTQTGRMRHPPPEWTVFVSLDDGRQIPLDAVLRDDAEATQLAAELERALMRLRAPKSYRG